MVGLLAGGNVGNLTSILSLSKTLQDAQYSRGWCDVLIIEAHGVPDLNQPLNSHGTLETLFVFPEPHF